MGKLQDITNAYKKRLLSHESNAAHILDAAYLNAAKSIQPKLDALLKQIADAQAKGEKLQPSWLLEKNRLSAILSTINTEMSKYGNISSQVTLQLQQQGVDLGKQAGMAQLNTTVPPGISYQFGVPSTKALNSFVGTLQDGSPLNSLFDSFGIDSSAAVRQALFLGLTMGQNPRQVAASVQQALGVSRARALTISRDQMIGAYRSANFATFRANNDVVDKWIWSANLAKACIACILMHGSIHDLDEEMDSHVQCACVPIPQTKPWLDIFSGTGIDTSSLSDDTMSLPSGEDWFNNQDESTQRSILGNAKYDALQDGTVNSVADFLGKTHSENWGNSIKVKSLAEASK